MNTEKRGSYSKKILSPSSMMYGPSKHDRTHRSLSSFSKQEWDARLDRLDLNHMFERDNNRVRHYR